MKNLILTIGLIISLISIAFNFFIFGYHNDLISNKEEELAFISYSNLYLSAEFNHAENMYFKSRFLELENRLLLEKKESFKDSYITDFINEDLAKTRIKAANYALNSSIDLVNTQYDKIEFSEIRSIINKFNSHKRLDDNLLGALSDLYVKYYQRHEEYILAKMNDKIALRKEIKDLKRKNGWMKFIAMSLQTIGLILVFLKDFKKN